MSPADDLGKAFWGAVLPPQGFPIIYLPPTLSYIIRDTVTNKKKFSCSRQLLPRSPFSSPLKKDTKGTHIILPAGRPFSTALICDAIQILDKIRIMSKINSRESRMDKLNCWEFNKCGRQPGGLHVDQRGVCPVATEKKLNGVHGGTNAGRACWVVGGTLCNGKVQETFAKKYDDCVECEFYKKVKNEEASLFQLSASLFMMLH